MTHSLLVVLLCFLAPFTPSKTVQVVRLSDLEARFKAGADTTYVVNLWATWCKPCVAELPWFERVHRESQANAPVKVVLVSLDAVSTLETVQRFVQRKGITAEVVVLNEAKPHTWIDRIDSSWSGAIPATLIVQGGGRTRSFFEQEFTYEELQSTLSTVFGRKQ